MKNSIRKQLQKKNNYHNLVKVLIFCVKNEAWKEMPVGRLKRNETIYKIYIDAGFPKSFVFNFTKTFPKIWFFFSFLLRIILKRKFKTEIMQDNSILLDHVSGCYKNQYNNISVPIHSEVKINYSIIDLVQCFPILIVNGLKVLNKYSATNPEIISRVLSSYFIALFYFKDNSHIKKLIINDDFMPNDLGILVAAKSNNKLIHVFIINDAHNRFNPPLWVDCLSCKTECQSLEKMRCYKNNYLNLKNKPFSLQKLPLLQSVKIGIPLPSKLNLAIIFEVLKKINSSLPLVYYFRLHPETKISNVILCFNTLCADYCLNAYLSSGDESLEIFSNNIDICLGGNSSATKDLFNLGVPVLYRDDLDDNGFDSHGWMRKGYFFDFRDKYEIDLKNIFCFYSNKKNLEKVF